MKNGKKSMRSVFRLGAGIIFIFLYIMILNLHVSAAGIRTLPVEMEVEQTSARDMLAFVNDFRTGDEAWQYNADNQKEYIKDAGELTYDYNLEQIAIQRAYEIAISFDHTRPNGESCFTCTYNGTSSCGENIAAGYETAEEVYIAFREDNYDYSGQGHRRNMLAPYYNAIGIGHVRYQGYDFWAQEFGWTNSGASYQAPLDGTVTATVEINTDNATLVLVPTMSYISDKYGNSGDLPGINGYYEMSDTWGAKGLPVPDSELSSIQWASEDTAIVTASGGGYTVVGNGSTKLIGSAMFEGAGYSCSVRFNAQKRYMNDEEIFVSVPNADFLPDGAEPKPVLTLNGMTLTEGVDYTLSYSYNKLPGTNARVIISGTGNFQSSRTESFEVYAVDINNCVIDPIADVTYTGNAIKPSITGTLGGQNITYNHYSISSIENNTDVGTATVVYQGRNGLTGTKEMTFQIIQRPLSDCTLSPISSKPYTGSEIIPSVSIRYNRTLTSSDYTVTCTNNVNIGTANVTITGKGNYTGSIQSTFEITKVPVSALSKSGAYSATYSGEQLKPVPVFTYSGKTLQEGTDYTITYGENINVGTGSYTITGRGVYEGTKEYTFRINARSIGYANFTIPSETRYYTGGEICPEITAATDGTRTLEKDVDYTVSYSSNIDARQYGYVNITGIGNYSGSSSIGFYISSCPISTLSVSSIASQTYTGEKITPDVSVKNGEKTLVNGTDYTLSYSNNTNVGTASITISGKGNYSGTKNATFKIVAKSISGATVDAISSQSYTGAAISPAVTVKDGSKTLKQGTDYTVAYSGNTNVGTATVTITGKGNYDKTKTASFKIIAKPVSELSVGAISNQTYTGSALTPAPVIKNGTITIKKDTDYTLSYSKNINAGIATIKVTGKGNYSGTRDINFTIKAKSVSGITIASIASQTYTGSALSPAVTAKDGSKVLTSGTDYSLSYKNNVNAGTATVTLTGKGNYSGTKDQTFIIQPKSVSGLTIGSVPEQTYTGLAILPEVTVKDGSKVLTKGADYTVSGSSNVSASKDKAMVTITGKGNYTGSKSVKFVINPANLADLTISDIPAQIYTGKAITPDPVIYFNGRKLTADVDFTADYKDNIKLGTAKVELTGIGNFTGKNQTEFIIQKERVYNVFSDVKKGQWYVSAIQYVYDYDIMAGKSATEFGTSQPLKREQFVQVLYNHMGKPEVTSANSFEDVKKGAYYYDAVLWAKENKIADGKIKNGKSIFGVGQNISREELALMLYRYAKLRGYNVAREAGATEGYADSNKVSPWAKEAMEWAVTRGIMSGKGGDDVPKSEIRLDPAGNATRAECASMMKKLLEMNQ